MKTKLPSTLSLVIPALQTIKRKVASSNVSNFEISRTFVLDKIDSKHMLKFKEAVGLNVPGVSLSYLYLIAQRAQIAIFVCDEFKFPIFGLVHIDNELKFTQHDQIIDVNKEIVIHCNQSNFYDEPSGKIFVDFFVEFLQEDKKVALCKSRYLASKPSKKSKSKNSEYKVNLHEFSHIDSFSFTKADGPKYALVSGDFNFIHLHPLVAKLFGFKSSIIHGMFTAAKAFAVIENEHSKLLKDEKVSFKKPILLPGNVNLFVNNACELKVLGKEEEILHLEGEFSFQ